jgi:hypothetical protein
MSRHYTMIDAFSPVPAVLLALGLMTGCGDPASPTSPTTTARDLRSAPLMISGHVYQQPSSAGEPAVADAVITLKDAGGAESSAVTDRRGYYCIEARPGEVVVTAAKEGYSPREWRFAVAGSTVLNFGLEPLLP